MASINSFADIVQDWETLLAALRERPELLPILETERLDLDKVLAEVRSLKARQEAQTAGRQELTQQIKAEVVHGKAVAIAIRAVAKGKLGHRNERLVQFRVAPVRRRPRKPVQPPPIDPVDPEKSSVGSEKQPGS